ncbi:hypothetical protein BJV77DRAFT_82238 [Russula vinacea]|nr:hypothetical protein BJV77DRAFT_82238 [Russula vinacea]
MPHVSSARFLFPTSFFFLFFSLSPSLVSALFRPTAFFHSCCAILVPSLFASVSSCLIGESSLHSSDQHQHQHRQFTLFSQTMDSHHKWCPYPYPNTLHLILQLRILLIGIVDQNW